MTASTYQSPPPLNRAHAAAELAGLQRTSRTVHRAVWGVAVGVMVYGAGNVTGLLLAHGVHPAIAWMLSPMVDLGLIVALVGGSALDRYGVRAGWLTMLRWTAGLMTWSLNAAGPALAPKGVDAVGVLIHSCGPVLLLFVAEAAASVQRGIAVAEARLRAEMDAAAPATPPAPPTPAPAAAPEEPAPATAPAKPRTSKSAATSNRPRRTAARPADVDELMPLGWRIAADHEARGIPLTRDRLRDAVRQTGQSISTDRAGVLLARLRTEAPADPADHPTLIPEQITQGGDH
ncbi:hypothetical protein JOL79_30935 [Microbispora sp. RL4-1S]|uniref:DUF2637 domain-containing protein n=1 Tax=Microbispora oryzae TaxID=2806554 RepID=A0A940WWH6_9ACTN|nr:hypothetical protein [Microbispora oryzae]MBP2708204.1 hypothetical protein [Microbispora oryzae]